MRVLIADDHDLLRDFLEAWLRKARIEVAVVADVSAALARLDGTDRFDLILLDYRMPGMQGLQGLARMLAQAGTVPVALMSGNAPRDVIDEALRLGAAGFLPKTLAPQAFVEAVRHMVSGARFLPSDPEAGAAPLSPAPVAAGALTVRERLVLAHLSEGRDVPLIAQDLGLGEPTVRLHLRTLCRKLGADTPEQAPARARAAGVV